LKLVFLGTSGCIPDIGDDTASMLIDDKYLVDVGWDVVRNLRNKGVDPISVNTVFFTHMHHDHHMSLPAFLFYHLQRKHTLEHLTLVGPKEDLELVCGLSLDYLQISRFFPECKPPVLRTILPGETMTLDEVTVTACPSHHAVPGLCYRFEDADGKALCLTGDTAYNKPMVEFFKDCDLLVHETSWGPGRADPIKNVHVLHSGAEEAGIVADEAHAKKLFLVHGPQHLVEACIQSAGKHFSGPIQWPQQGVPYTV